MVGKIATALTSLRPISLALKSRAGFNLLSCRQNVIFVAMNFCL
jgi:hypothetical protein